MSKDETLKNLMEKYPEDLNDTHKCYWWWVGPVGSEDVTYWVLLKNKHKIEEGNPYASNVLMAHSSDPQKLIDVLEAFLQTDMI